MSKDKNQYWVVQKDGARRSLRRTRKSSIWAYVQSRAALTGSYYTSTQIMPLWRCLYKEGYRCVKVWVYQEPAAKQLDDIKLAFREFENLVLFTKMPEKALDALEKLEKAAFGPEPKKEEPHA